MRSAVWVLSIFAALWGVLAVTLAHWANIWMLLPCAMSVALIAIGERIAFPRRTDLEEARARKFVGWAFGIEMVAIILVCNMLVHFGASSYVVAAAVAIVGLHFVPLAIWLPARAYYATGGLLVLAVALGLSLPGPLRDPAITIAAALILWGTVASFLWTSRRFSPR